MNRNQIISLLTSAKAQKYIDQVESFVKNLPHLPKSIIDVIVQITPWIVGISGIFSAINGIQYVMYAFGVGTLKVVTGISPAYWLLLGIQQLIASYLSLLAFQLLRDRKYTGWVLLFWTMVSAAAASIITIVFIPWALVPSIVGVLVGVYLTFEIKNDFMNEVSTPSSKATSSKKK